jgi:hypothetical protein
MARSALLTMAVLATFCGLAGAADRPASPLFARLGGAAIIDAVVNETVEAAAKSGATIAADRPAARLRLAQFICARTGGGCSSKAAGAEFDALIAPLRIALRAHQVPLTARNELLEALAPARRDFAQR